MKLENENLNESENPQLNIGAVISCKKSYSRDEVITLIKNVLKATGDEIKTTMHIKGSYVEFDGKDLDNWIERNV
jgi:hypothetical protein